MKKYLILYILFYFGSATVVLAQNTAEEAAIRALLEAETKTFCNASLSEVGKQHWILDDKTILNVSMPDGTHLQMTKDDILDATETPPPNHATFANKDFRFSIQGDIAFVTYTQTATLADGSRISSHEMRILEKVNGTWKIHISSVHQFVPRD